MTRFRKDFSYGLHGFSQLKNINPKPDIDLTVIDQLAVAKETFMFEAKMGSVGPVILYKALFKYSITYAT